MVGNSLTTPLARCTELDTLQRTTKYSSTKRQQGGQLMIFFRAITTEQKKKSDSFERAPCGPEFYILYLGLENERKQHTRQRIQSRTDEEISTSTFGWIYLNKNPFNQLLCFVYKDGRHVAGSGHKPCILHISRWDMNQTIKNTSTSFYTDILRSCYHTNVHVFIFLPSNSTRAPNTQDGSVRMRERRHVVHLYLQSFGFYEFNGILLQTWMEWKERQFVLEWSLYVGSKCECL